MKRKRKAFVKVLEKVKLVLVNIRFRLNISMQVMVTNPDIGFGAWHIYLVYYALVECWACKWFALSLFARVSKRSFQVWMNIVITTLQWLLVWLSHGLFLNSIFAWSPHTCFICISCFSTYNDHGVLLCFRRFMFIWFKSFTVSKIRCEWVMFNCSQLTC